MYNLVDAEPTRPSKQRDQDVYFQEGGDREEELLTKEMIASLSKVDKGQATVDKVQIEPTSAELAEYGLNGCKCLGDSDFVFGIDDLDQEIDVIEYDESDPDLSNYADEVDHDQI